jgi:hypothetical protein
MPEAYKTTIPSSSAAKWALGCKMVVYSNTTKTGEYQRSGD